MCCLPKRGMVGMCGGIEKSHRSALDVAPELVEEIRQTIGQ
jgi:hypothetical protein